jgi:hypothetical protein
LRYIEISQTHVYAQTRTHKLTRTHGHARRHGHARIHAHTLLQAQHTLAHALLKHAHLGRVDWYGARLCSGRAEERGNEAAFCLT